jgi:hypothetical protein
MKLKIDAGYRSVDVSQGEGLSYKDTPYVKADIDIDIEFVKYFDDRMGEANSQFHKALCNALMHICSQIARGSQVF